MVDRRHHNDASNVSRRMLASGLIDRAPVNIRRSTAVQREALSSGLELSLEMGLNWRLKRLIEHLRGAIRGFGRMTGHSSVTTCALPCMPPPRRPCRVLRQ
jgi:hypothetical protein